MYNYREAVKSDIREWMEENRKQWEDMDYSDAENLVYESIWVDDSVTGNASGSYTFSRSLARQNVFEDDDSEEYLRQMADDEFTTSQAIGHAFISSDWEWLDVTIRCYLCGECLAEVMKEYYTD